MKILQTIPGLSLKSGGPSTCTYDMMVALNDIGLNVDLLTVSSDDILGRGCSWLKDVENDYATPFFKSRNIQRFLVETNYDLYHANALWMGPIHDTCRIARNKKKPYIISPHGMLYPTALAVHSWKKRFLLKAWYNKDIHNAACLHATCRQEAEYIRQFGYKGPIAIIPNGVVVADNINLKDEFVETKDLHGRKRIGFLGRLHPIKKIENVLYALSEFDSNISNEICFQIIGKYDERYEQWLKEEVKRLHLEKCVEFVGFVSGKEKFEHLSKLSALMVPSVQENFGMIVPEALICGTPVYASFGTPWNELNECNCGWWRDNSPETIYGVIREIITKDDNELRTMGANGRRLIEEKYERHKVACMMEQLYKWICVDYMGEDCAPEFVLK